MLDTKRVDGDRRRPRRKNDVGGDGAVLLTAADDVANVKEQKLVGAVLDLERVDLAAPALADFDGPALQTFVESDVGPRVSLRTAHHVDRELPVTVGSLDFRGRHDQKRR